jgi:hypothetical protein
MLGPSLGRLLASLSNFPSTHRTGKSIPILDNLAKFWIAAFYKFQNPKQVLYCSTCTPQYTSMNIPGTIVLESDIGVLGYLYEVHSMHTIAVLVLEIKRAVAVLPQWRNPESCKSFHCTPTLCNWPTTAKVCRVSVVDLSLLSIQTQPTLYSPVLPPGCCCHLRSEWCYQILRERESERAGDLNHWIQRLL